MAPLRSGLTLGLLLGGALGHRNEGAMEVEVAIHGDLVAERSTLGVVHSTCPEELKPCNELEEEMGAPDQEHCDDIINQFAQAAAKAAKRAVQEAHASIDGEIPKGKAIEALARRMESDKCATGCEELAGKVVAKCTAEYMCKCEHPGTAKHPGRKTMIKSCDTMQENTVSDDYTNSGYWVNMAWPTVCKSAGGTLSLMRMPSGEKAMPATASNCGRLLGEEIVADRTTAPYHEQLRNLDSSSKDWVEYIIKRLRGGLHGPYSGKPGSRVSVVPELVAGATEPVWGEIVEQTSSHGDANFVVQLDTTKQRVSAVHMLQIVDRLATVCKQTVDLFDEDNKVLMACHQANCDAGEENCLTKVWTNKGKVVDDETQAEEEVDCTEVKGALDAFFSETVVALKQTLPAAK